MAGIPASNSITFCKASAPIIHRSCWLVEKIKELFRKIIAFFSPYTKVDLETRLSRLVKMDRVEDITSCLDFEVTHITTKSKDGRLEVLYGELERFHEALVHVCAMKKLGSQKAENIYEQLLKRFSEGDLLEVAFTEVKKYNKLAWDVSDSLRERKILPDKKVDDFTTNLISKVAAREKRDALIANLRETLGKQGNLFRLFQNLKNCYQEKEKLLSQMSIKGLDRINQDIERFSKTILMQRAEMRRQGKSTLSDEKKEGLDLESRKEIERLEIERDVQEAWCDGIEERLSQLSQQYKGLLSKEVFVRKARFAKYPSIFSHLKKSFLEKIGQGHKDIAKDLQRFLSRIKTRNN